MKSVIKKLGFSLLVMLFMMAFHDNTYGQRPVRKAIREKIETQQIAFISRQLNLTPEEAKVFWPVYNEFQQKKQSLNKDFKEKIKLYLENNKSLTEAQYKEFADQQLIQEQCMLDLKKEYHSKFLAILPASKVVKLYQADRQFKRILLKRLKDRPDQKKNEYDTESE